jgi:Reverse transcriptase (RNA-dependent DNA polymerase)
VEETERLHKIVKAMMAQVDLTMSDEDINELGISTEDIKILEQAFPATEINGIKIPQTYKEAINDPQYSEQWKDAMNEELISLLKNGTWKEVVPPKDVNLVSTKWVYHIKTRVDGTIERFKARLVARGFSQIHGHDYTETFAPTVRMDTLRLFLAAVAAEDLECAQFDIKNAFTESHLKEKIYLTAPKGVEVKKGCVLQVLRSLYGLKQAARDWNLLIKKELLNWGFVQSLADPCMFRHEERGIKLLVYVDDIVAAARKQDQIDWFYKQLSGRFDAKNLGEIGKILGVRVARDRANRTIYIDQEQYLRAVLDKFGITQKTHKDKKIPAADYESFRPATKDDTRINITEYQQGIGSLMFAMVLTRPDIAFALGKLSQFMSDPVEHHGHALKNLMRYLNSTITQKLCYSPGGAYKHFVVYSDADWASDKVDRKSISGSVVMFYGGPISWSSKKQRSVATSSCESEYMALSTCTKQGQWVAQIFRDLGLAKYIGKDPNCVQMLGDNQGALALVKNPRLHERSKHIDICYHFIRDLEEQGKLSVTYIPTSDMIADGMTKPFVMVGRYA